MKASVLIPTFGRAATLRRCLSALSTQTLARDGFEVIVAIDGPDDATARVCNEMIAHLPLRVLQCPRQGYTGARRRLVDAARFDLMVSLNDDVEPEPGFLEAHLSGHSAAGSRRVIIVGDSPWRIFEGDSLTDRLVRETSLVFFYDRMYERGRSHGHEPNHDWGFRHCFGLNFSCALDSVRRAGGFTAFAFTYGYDDIELAFRLVAQDSMPVLFRPEARATHNHRYLARDLLAREVQLGKAAWRFAGANPAFANAVFRRDIRAPEYLSELRQHLESDAAHIAALERAFLALDAMPANAVLSFDQDQSKALQSLYETYLPLKRRMWRCGLLEAAAEPPLPVIK